MISLIHYPVFIADDSVMIFGGRCAVVYGGRAFV